MALVSSSTFAMLIASVSSGDISIKGGAPKESCSALAPRILALSNLVRWSGPMRPEISSTGAFFLDGPGFGWPAVARTPLMTLTLGAFLTGAGLGAFGALGGRAAFSFLAAAGRGAFALRPLASAELDVDGFKGPWHSKTLAIQSVYQSGNKVFRPLISQISKNDAAVDAVKDI